MTDSEIRYSVTTLSLGFLLVARSARGVCAILMGDAQEALQQDLQDRFPGVPCIRDDAALADAVAKVARYIEDPAVGLDLTLDVRGTAFQQRVWQALQALPVGATVSYTEIARQIGAPSAVRAVAQACGANALGVAIPCHRVLRSDGGLSGYRWGVWRKRELLDREARAAAAN